VSVTSTIDSGATAPSPAYPGYVPRPPGLLSRIGARIPRWTGPAAVAACFAGGSALVIATNPTDAGAFDGPSCIFKLTTGLDCPGCGGTRAFYFLLQSNLPEAARHHAVAVFAAPFLVWLYVAWVAQAVFGKRIPTPRLTGKVITAFLSVWAVFTVMRNLPWAPFNLFYV
jgi:hypothetical protein